MRQLANIVLVIGFLCFGTSCFAQDKSAAADPFGGNPFGRSAPAAAKPPRAPKAPEAATPKARKIPARSSDEVTRRILATLNDETTHTFVEYPLHEAIRSISEAHDIPIVVDRRALEEVGISPDVPVNLSLKNVSLRSFLRLMLRDYDLTYIVKDEVMQITTIEVAEKHLVVEMYRFPEALTEKADKVVRALTGAVATDAWDVQGGPCTVSAIENILVVSATGDIHDEVHEFLDKLHDAFESRAVNKR